jgi:uncharacterized membrane protein YgcG
MATRFTVLSFLIFLSFSTRAQTFAVRGNVSDAKDNSAIISVSVQLFKATDSTQKTGTVTDVSGDFELGGVAPGKYMLRLDYLGYKQINKPVEVAGADVNLGKLRMSSSEHELKGVTIRDRQIRAEQNGDTSQFRADAFKTHPDASAEDLVTKMPGVTSDNNGVKVNGETVQQVTVDGKPFFGTDPTLALKNLPAEIVDKIQVFDKLSDQAQFTGFDDGTSQKTMNIVTRRNKSEGTFGKAFAGYGSDDRYIAGGNINIFNGDQRISVLGLTNNINQQNFSSQDLLGVSSGSGSNRGGGSSGRGNFGGGGGGSFGGGGNNFLVGQQGGITTTNSLGLNYSDTWGKKIKVSGSYFFNNTNNNNTTDLARNYFTSGDSTNVYHEFDNSSSKNYNHRFNLRFEYTIDSFNSIIFTPGISFQKNNATSGTNANDSLMDVLASSTLNNTVSNNSGYSANNNLLLQHKFRKPRRTISLNVGNTLNEKTGNGSYYASNQYANLGRPVILDQQNNTYNNGFSLNTNVTYTEPVGKKGQIMATYSPSYSKTVANKQTYNFDTTTHDYQDFDTALSNKYNTTYITQKGGLSYRIGDKKFNFNIGANVQYATLSGDQQFPNVFSLNKNFTDVLPNLFYNYRFADGRNLRVMYRTSTQAPSISQLENVLDVSNPLLLKTGNASLRQDYEHTLIVRYGLTDAKKAHNFFLNVYANYANNYIGNATYSGTSYYDEFTKQTILLNKGAQLTRPVNIDGYVSTRTFLTYGIPLLPVKSNLNLSGGFNYTRTPGLVNAVTNYANNYIPSAGIVISSNVSEKLDFTLSFNGNYNIVDNTAQTQSNNNYYNHTASFKINYMFLKHFVFNTNITENYYTSFSSTGNQDFYQWNAYLGYKLLKNNALEARITAFDILNQNKSISRTVTETYIENSVTQVLRQYFMFQLTYTIRNFKGTMPTEESGRDRPMMPGGMFPGGPGGPGGRPDHGGM